MFNLKKWYKGLTKKQRILLFSVVFIGLVWLLRRQKATTTANARLSANALPYRVFDPNKVYKMIMLTDTAFWKQRFDAIAKSGFDTVQLVIPYSETYKGDFNFYLNLADYATKLGLNLVLKTWVRISNPMLLNDFTDADLMKNQSGTALQENGYTLSFNSPKWSVVYDWFRKVKAAFQPYQDAGYIVAHFPACNETQEWIYPLPMYGDWSQAETTGSSGLNQTRGIAYMNYQTSQLREKLHVIAAIFSGWNNGLDVGSFYYDFHKWAGSYNFESIADSVDIKFIKNNPINDNTAQFNAALSYDWKRRKGKYFSAEYTNSPGTTSIETLVDNHAVMIDNGCNLLSFAFHAPDANGAGEAFNKALSIKDALIERSLWNTSVKTPTKTGDFTYTVQELFDNGHIGIVNNFNSNPQRAVRIAS